MYDVYDDDLMYVFVTKRIGDADSSSIVLSAFLTGGSCPENHANEFYVNDNDGGVKSDNDLKITSMP